MWRKHPACDPNLKGKLKLAPLLFHDLERSLLPVAASRTGEQSPNGVNSLAVATDDFSDIALPHLKLEDGRPATGDFRKHDLVRKLDELPDDELEELFHIDLNCSDALSASLE
jgi:hypothetical protein